MSGMRIEAFGCSRATAMTRSVIDDIGQLCDGAPRGVRVPFPNGYADLLRLHAAHI